MKTSTVFLLMASVIAAPHLNKGQAIACNCLLYLGALICLVRGD